MSIARGRLSGSRINYLADMFVEDWEQYVELYVKEMMRDKYPPIHVPLDSPRAVYDRLVAARAAGDPDFYSSPEAQALLQKLSQQFGPPPSVIQSPYGGTF